MIDICCTSLTFPSFLTPRIRGRLDPIFTFQDLLHLSPLHSTALVLHLTSPYLSPPHFTAQHLHFLHLTAPHSTSSHCAGIISPINPHRQPTRHLSGKYGAFYSNLQPARLAKVAMNKKFSEVLASEVSKLGVILH